jgi:hypothetical protein
MSAIQISLRKAGAARAINRRESPIAAGDQVTITAAHDAASILCFSADAAGLLSASNRVELAGGASVSYTVGSPAALEYVILVQAHGWPVPSEVPAGKSSDSAKLVLRDASGKDFPGPDDPPVNSGDGTGTGG